MPSGAGQSGRVKMGNQKAVVSNQYSVIGGRWLRIEMCEEEFRPGRAGGNRERDCG